ncbi:MAG: UDP-N-acetylglucosamine 2-epimerase, partial [Actinobacteria bacterium]|nr:UDP-N-acetylglucosamine 2-epimerase [Actinomycetota bacterium]
MKVLTVVGNRPQFVKSGPLSFAFLVAGVEEIVVHTGQHYDRELSEVFVEELGLPRPQYRLELKTADPDVMEPEITRVIRREEPDLVLVYGDTNSTLAGARASA